MKVIGTAGHIDHGKSALVRRLTGIDPDRLEEEKRRGMTIDLGFAWLALPSGTEVSIVDVPGHERFVKNMLAGAGGIDVALLVVAADEGVMPQTREHLGILDLLEVRSGVVALTKADLVDEEWVQLVTEDVEALMQETALEGSTIVPVSAVTGEGLDALLAALDEEVAGREERSDRGRPYVPVDRVFTIQGFGTVATGTLHDGTLRVGQELEIAPSGRRARIRGLHVHQAQVESAGSGARVALNLAGVDRDDVGRGDVLALPGTVRSIRRFDARLRVLGDAPFALRHGTEVTVHVGAAERAATVSLLEAGELEPGTEGWVQLRLREPVAAVRGQRFIVRLPAPARTVAGGQVVDLAPRHRRADVEALHRLGAMVDGSRQNLVMAAMTGRRTRSVREIAAAADLPEEEVVIALDALQKDQKVLSVGAGYLRTEAAEELKRTVQDTLSRFHKEHPLRQGMPREQLRATLRRSATEWPALVAWLAREGALREDSGAIAATGAETGLGSRRADADRVLEALRREPYTPPSGSDLIRATGADAELLEAMRGSGEIVRVAEGLYLTRTAYDELVARSVEIICSEGEVTVASLRDRVGTSRKYALALLEHLDGERITRRVGDSRVLGSRAPACA